MPRLTYLDRDDVEVLAHRLATTLFSNYPDPLPAFQVREGGALLDSALGIVQQPYYRTLYDKAGVVLRSLIKNHALVDGNKRMAMATTALFPLMNGYVLIPSS